MISSHSFRITSPQLLYRHTLPAITLLLLVILLIAGCKSTEIREETPEQTPAFALEHFFDSSPVFEESHTGFALYDPDADTMLYDRQSHRFFVPASNTKIFTLFAALKTFGEKLPSLRYEIRNDTLYFRGTGDPTFLNPVFENQETFDFLKNHQETLAYYDGHFTDDHFGSGWSWDWYPAPYAPEKAPFPIYGNMVRLQTQQVMLVKLDEKEPVKPAFFEKYIDRLDWNSSQMELVTRELRDNRLMYAPKSDTARQERQIPFVYDRDLFIEMLSDTLGRDVIYSDNPPVNFENTLYGTPADTVYRRLMQISDNFIAEQLMLMISDKNFGSMNTNRAISYSVENFLDDLPDRPRWADGSGLTRYNLMTPRSIVMLLDKLYDEYGEEKILPMFPAGGKSGTISSLYAPPDGGSPFVYAKTGTLRNNVTLSGYLYTDSGRRLIFSFMNNNYVVSNNQIRSEMQKVLNLIREEY